MSTSEDLLIYPLPPIPDSAYAAATGETVELDDDALAINVYLVDVMARGLADLAGEDWFDEPTADGCNEEVVDMAGRCLNALVRLDLVRLSDFVWHEGAQTVTRVHP